MEYTYLQNNPGSVASVDWRGEVHSFRFEEERHLEVLHALPGHCADLHALHVSARLLQRDPRGDELRPDAFRVRSGRVAFGDRHDVAAIRRLDVRRRLARLRHDAIVRGAHQHRDVRAPRAPLSHRGESRVPRRVQEGELAAVGEGDDERADVLRYSASLPRGDGRAPQGVQQRGLAVVHVPHHRDDGASRWVVRDGFLVRARCLSGV